MSENIHAPSGAAGSDARRGGARPSARTVAGLLEWVQQAQTVNWPWVRNFLAVLGLLLALLLAAKLFSGSVSPVHP